MTQQIVVSVDGLQGAADDVKSMGSNVELNIVRALNRTIDSARTASARMIRQQVNLPAQYLNRPDRLGVTKRAQRGDLEAVITGRSRPTSLARFATYGRVRQRGGVDITVKPGHSVHLKKAFFVNLRSGNTDGLGNLGLAIRLPKGQRPDRAYKPQPLGDGLWLLYGPSLAQVFDDVAVEITPSTADNFEAEFSRLMDAGVR
jgi:hypothetical protein